MKPHYLAAFFAGLALAPAYSGQSPVLVELFTSQGCSSCPPAEDWLNKEGMGWFKQGKILPLAFHVDYWNYLGWKDPFSSGDFTERQRVYAQAFASDFLYTPEIVVGGRVGFVGSDASRVREEIGEARKTMAGALQLKKVSHGKEMEITLPPGLPKQGVKLYLAVFENGLTTQVERGENAGRILTENFVVRRLVEIPFKSPPLRTVLPQVGEGDAANLGVAVFAQDAAMKILAAGCLYPLN